MTLDVSGDVCPLRWIQSNITSDGAVIDEITGAQGGSSAQNENGAPCREVWSYQPKEVLACEKRRVQ